MINNTEKDLLLNDNDIENDNDYYDNDNMYTPLIDNSKIMVYNYRNSVKYYCCCDFISTFITFIYLESNIRYLYIFYLCFPILGLIGSNHCNIYLLSLYSSSITINIIFKFIFFFQFNVFFKIFGNLINIILNTWIIYLLIRFIKLIKKLNTEEIQSIINKDYIPEYKINFIYY